MRLLSWLVFVPLQILWLPLSILGAVLVAWKQMVISKRLGVSQTAIEVINGRWAMHLFGMRDDEATDRLAKALPNTSTTGLFLALFPIWVKWKTAGELALYPRVVEPGAEGLGELVTTRTTRFDGIMERVLGEDVTQFVLLGAGYDTRAFGMFRRDGVAYFEVDQETVQAHKRAVLESAGLDNPSVRFVTVDFGRDDLFPRLEDAGYDPSRKTLFLWEGVTLYLSEQAVRETMRVVRDHSAKGSVLLADLYASRLVDMMKQKIAAATLDWTDEGAGFGLPLEQDWEQRLGAFVERESLRVGERWFLGSSSPKGPFSVVVEMVV